ncbi:Uncharacterised protein [Mycobacterium tuberculosis]|uniref:Uncharacterized protein n=1 Tax=Mycobacterium tuberculosis TaxID=1773 RepID=A0A916LBK9_MYCTX|nr:Uncharacterised protein [Mycobacterium tuberculosis]COX06249.1 Uncharacterised protein [Mycobacterium tuberculosis]COX50673.1 Uncharacterised protein [Mycobacterium tuberculosis]COY40352.1 Uncharacterised protein [Mycobacterium tuberculosis]
MVQATTAWVDPKSATKVRCATLTTVTSTCAITEARTHTPAVRSNPTSSLSG